MRPRRLGACWHRSNADSETHQKNIKGASTVISKLNNAAPGIAANNAAARKPVLAPYIRFASKYIGIMLPVPSNAAQIRTPNTEFPPNHPAHAINQAMNGGLLKYPHESLRPQSQ
jgi:hypothetical protein